VAAPAIGLRPGFAPRGAVVDWSHQLASRLVVCNVADYGTNLASGHPITRTVMRHDVRAGGLGMGSSVVAGSVTTPCEVLTTTAAGAARPASVFMLITPNTWPGGFSALLHKSASATARDFVIFVNTSGDVSYVITATGRQVVSTISTGMTTGRTWAYLAVADGASSVLHYVNGRLMGTSTLSGTASLPTAPNMRYGDNSTGGGSAPDVTYHAVHAWTRALTAADAAALYADPYCMLRR
jgi:hypothetical protein